MYRIEHDAILQLEVPDVLRASATRALAGRTALDKQVDDLVCPSNPTWLRASIAALRWYRSVRPQWISQRCVWDPSCSRYAELALRRRGLLRGVVAVVSRLSRCRPGRGGTDNP
jgi:putative component of membrane protein insertase Oxa1/YidC/SpoIIIJ protein YidD